VKGRDSQQEFPVVPLTKRQLSRRALKNWEHFADP
jgi:hypothetical protein